MNTALQRRNRRIRAALRRIAADRGDLLAQAVLEQTHQPEPLDPDRPVITGWVNTYRDWTQAEMAEAWGK